MRTMKISKRIHSNNLNYILAAAIIYCMVVLFVICANWMTGSHVFDYHLTVSLYVGLHVWSSILYGVAAAIICILIVIHVLSIQTKIIQKFVYFLIVFGIMGCAMFSCAPSRNRISTVIHNYFSYALILTITFSLILMMLFSQTMRKRIFALAGVVFASVFIFCFGKGVPIFLELLLLWENIFIFVLLIELMLESNQRSE